VVDDPFSVTYVPEENKSAKADIPAIFLKHAADLLGDTKKGFSGSQIVELTVAYAVEHNIALPHSACPFDAPNKRAALYENILAFPAPIQYQIIKDLCHHSVIQESNKEAADDLLIKLVTRYGHLDDHANISDINPRLIEETRHWLNRFPEVLKLYNSALQKHDSKVFMRNLLDDLRLALEKLVQKILGNEKALENQVPLLGQVLKKSGGSAELCNMFLKLVEYFTRYQNSYVKHDDAVIETEVEFVFEITSSFMKHLVRLDLLLKKTNY